MLAVHQSVMSSSIIDESGSGQQGEVTCDEVLALTPEQSLRSWQLAANQRLSWVSFRPQQMPAYSASLLDVDLIGVRSILQIHRHFTANCQDRVSFLLALHRER